MWNRIVGHQQEIAALRRALAEQRLAPAMLLVGPDGVGKRRIARTIVQHLFCAAGAAPCGTCVHCVRTANDAHPDCLIVQPDPEKSQREILIEQIRALKHRMTLHPLETAARGAIIEAADTMNNAAGNTMLKLLEEPPARTYFFLIAVNPERLLATIRSRCRTMVFQPLASADVLTVLTQRGVDPIEARQRSALADGSPGAALAVPLELFDETLQACFELLTHRSMPRLLDLAEQWAADPGALQWRCELLARVWRDAVLATTTSSAHGQLPGTDAVRTQLQSRPATRLLRELELLLAEAPRLTTTTFNRQLTCERLLLELTQ